MKKYSELELSIQYSESVIKHYAKSFYFASSFLPRDKKFGAYAVYCFCRYADNVVDNPRNRTIEEIKIELDHFRNELDLSYKYGESEHPALSAFAHYARKYSIPREYAFDLVDGVEMDLEIKSYESFDDLYVFCYKVASTVGLMMSMVLGVNGDKALLHAEELGIAMQITNILRDIKEDKDMDRIYVPKEDLRKFNVSEQMIENEIFNSDFESFMKFYVEKAESYYEKGNKGIPMIDKDGRFAIQTASKIYAGILVKIKENNYNPFKERAAVKKSKKFAILFKELLKKNF